jgi:hypothetical protein
MAWYNNAKDLQKKVTPSKNVTAVATGGLSTLKPVGDAWSTAVKQPTQAVGQSVSTGSIKPLWQNVKNNAGIVTRPFQEMLGGNDNKQNSAPPPPEEPSALKSMGKLTLTDIGGGNIGQDFGSMIGQNESADTNLQNVRNQYAAMGSLAKLREGANAQSEQNAIQRRLASSGMGSSGAGLRLQNLASQQSARRGAETQLGIAAEQAGKELSVGDATTARNLQREQLRLGAAESAAGRQFSVQQAQRQGEQAAQQFELDKNIALSNQATARDIQRYNDRGLLGQLFGDIFGGGAIGGGISMKKPFG